MQNNIADYYHYLIYKPTGYHSQFILAGNKKKRLLGDLHEFEPNTMAIGRLDKPSEGLLILTTDGKMSELVRSKSVEKEYYAQVDGTITEDALLSLSSGVVITVDKQPYLTLPAKANKLSTPPILPDGHKIRDDRHGPTSWISITLTQGKYRQVRKMTAAVGFPTLRLVRYRIGQHTIENMDAGSVVPICTQDLVDGVKL